MGDYSGLNQIFFKSDGPKNWASDEKVRERVRKHIMPLCKHVQSRRMALTTYWQSLFRIWGLEHEEQAYQGSSNLYIPAGRRIIDTLVANAVAMTFPSDDAFAVEAIDEGDHDQESLEIKAMLQSGLEKAQLRANADAFYRLFFICGNAVYKTRWHERKYKVMKKARTKSTTPGSSIEQDLLSYKPDTVTAFCGPMADIVHPGNFFAWPENVLDLREAYVVFETFTRALSDLKREATERQYPKMEMEKLSGDQRDDNKIIVDSMNLVGQGMSTVNSDGDRAGVPLIDLTEVWVDFDPENDPDSDTHAPVPFLITFTAGGSVLRVVENIRAAKTHPYKLARLGKIQGRLWGSGVAEAIQPLQQLLNDQTNQAMDCARYSLNPYALFNPDLVHGKLPALEPGIAIPVVNIGEAIKWDRPPVEMIQASAGLISQTTSWMQDYGMSPPVLMGGAAPGRAQRSATGVSASQTNAMRPLTEIVRSVEEEVWEPVLQDFYALYQQFGTDEVTVKFGKNIKRLTPAELVGDYTFRWLASQQATNQQVKSQQITQLLSIIGNPGLSQALGANGVKANPVPLLKRLIREGFGFRDADEIIVPLQPGEQPPGPPNGQGGGQQQPPVPGTEGSLAGNDQTGADTSGPFGGVRVEANTLAAIGGMMNSEDQDE